MHLRVKFLCRRPGGIRPGDVVHAKIVGAVGGVPHIVAVSPRQDAGERGIEVEEGPGDDGVVVEGHIQSDDADGVSYTWNTPEDEKSFVAANNKSVLSAHDLSSSSGLTFENGTDVFPYWYGSSSVKLSQCQLHVEERNTTKDGHQNVGNKESTCTERWDLRTFVNTKKH